MTIASEPIQTSLPTMVSPADWPVRRNTDKKPFTDEQLIDHLKSLLSEHGYLSVNLIDADPDYPGKNFYRRRFGGLRKAYALAGYFSTQSEILRAAIERNRAVPTSLDKNPPDFR